jgi:hypothetical protein
MYVYIDAADRRFFARRTAAERRQERHDALAASAFAMVGLVVSFLTALVFPEALEMTPELFLFL